MGCTASHTVELSSLRGGAVKRSFYQLVPQPSQRNCQSHHAAEYGYQKGQFFPSSGHIRVHVSHEQADVDYVRAVVGQNMQRQGVANGRSSYSYTCGTDLK